MLACALGLSGCGSGAPAPGGCGHGVIDTMEDGDNAICQNEGRVGQWYTLNDGTGTQTPAESAVVDPSLIAGGRGASTMAMHTFGQGCTGWGAALGLQLDDSPGGSLAPYDASAYSGIQFWVRGHGMTHFELTEVATSSAANGGTCKQNCGDGYGDLIDLNASWTKVVLPFDHLWQLGVGTPARFDRRTLLGAEFLMPGDSPFDLWVDDIAFF